MSEADKMLEELGYTLLKERGNGHLAYAKGVYEEILIGAPYSNKEEISKWNCGDCVPLSLKEFLAVHEKMKELWWI